MIHFLAGMSLMYIIAAMREEWIRATRVSDYRNKVRNLRQGYAGPYPGNGQPGPNVDAPTIQTTDGPVSALPPLLPYPPLYRIK